MWLSSTTDEEGAPKQKRMWLSQEGAKRVMGNTEQLAPAAMLGKVGRVLGSGLCPSVLDDRKVVGCK